LLPKYIKLISSGVVLNAFMYANTGPLPQLAAFISVLQKM